MSVDQMVEDVAGLMKVYRPHMKEEGSFILVGHDLVSHLISLNADQHFYTQSCAYELMQ